MDENHLSMFTALDLGASSLVSYDPNLLKGWDNPKTLSFLNRRPFHIVHWIYCFKSFSYNAF